MNNFRDRLEKDEQAGYTITNVAIKRDEIYMPKGLEKKVDKLVNSWRRTDDLGTELGFRGVLMTGANGVGKTLLAHYIAGELECDLHPVKSLPTAEVVSFLFSAAREAGASEKKLQLLLFDEFHKYSNREDLADPKHAEVIDQLKIEMDGGTVSPYLKWICMTDKPDKIDTALRRNKRLGIEWDIYPPNEEGRLEILNIHAFKYNHENFKENGDGRIGHRMVFRPEDLEEISGRATHGFSGDDLWGLLAEAADEALFNDTNEVKLEYLLQASKEITPTALKDMPFAYPKYSFDGLKGIDDHIALIKDYIGEGYSADDPGKSVMIYGPSGVGKTSLGEAIAEYYHANLIKVRGSALLHWYLGKTGHEFEKVLNRAKIAAPSLLLLDEISAFVKTKEIHGYKDTWTGKMRSLMDDKPNGVIIASTLVDPRLLEDETKRRFDIHLAIPSPAEDALAEIWDHYLPELGGDRPREETITNLILDSKNFTGDDISQICNRVERYKIQPNAEVFQELCRIQSELKASSDDNYTFDHVREYHMLKHFPRREE